MILSHTSCLSQTKKYPIVRSEGKDTVVVMTVRQADAMNSRLEKMKGQIDSLSKSLSALRKSKSMEVDSVSKVIEKMAEGPSFIYKFKNDVYSIDLSLYKIKMNSIGRVKLKKMRKRQIGRYFELFKSNYENSIDWKEQFREFDLPMMDENKFVQ